MALRKLSKEAQAKAGHMEICNEAACSLFDSKRFIFDWSIGRLLSSACLIFSHFYTALIFGSLHQGKEHNERRI